MTSFNYAKPLANLRSLVSISLIGSALATLTSHASLLEMPVEDLLTKYNMVALGNYNTSSHSEGRILVYGSVSGQVNGAANNMTVSSASDETVILAGEVEANMTVDKGNVRLSTNGVNSTLVLTNGGKRAEITRGGSTYVIQVNGSGKIILDSTMEISSSAQDIKDFAIQVGNLTNDTGASLTVDNQGNLLGNLVDSNGDGLVVVNLAYSSLASIGNNNDKQTILNQLANVDGVVVNVTGSPTGTLKNNNWNNDAFASKVLFNFVDTEAGDTITIASNGQFQGSILAPEADINSIGNVIEGLVIANDVYTGGQELHLPNLDTVFAQKLIAAVPEPSTYALIFGFTSIMFVALKRRSR